MRAVIIALAFGLFGQAAHADGTRSPRAAVVQPHVCLDLNFIGSDPDCQMTFDAALRSTATDEVVVTAQGMGSASSANDRFRGAQPLQFQKRAPWVRRLERLGKEGIPFFRVPHGPDSELVVGINRKGRLGFEMKQTHH